LSYDSSKTSDGDDMTQLGTRARSRATVSTTHHASAPFALVALALGIVYVVWGSTYLGIRVVVADAPPLTSMGLRFVTAGLLLATVLALRNGLRVLAVTRRQLAGAALLGLMLPVLGNGLVSVGENLGAESGSTALLIAIAPLMVIVFRVVEHDRPRGLTVAGVLLGFAGLAALVLAAQGSGAVPLGPALLVLFAASCWALGSFLQPKLATPANAFVTAVYEMLAGGLVMLVVGPVAGERFDFDYPLKTWVALGYLVVFGSVVAFSSYVWLLSSAPISLVATYAYVNPVVAVFLGWLILDEQPTGAMLAGGAVVVGSVALVITSERRPAPSGGEPGPCAGESRVQGARAARTLDP
jgi:drug/metabolite transporter (DMT)-like permease